jgi:hypothetical protein
VNHAELVEAYLERGDEIERLNAEIKWLVEDRAKADAYARQYFEGTWWKTS